MIIKYQYQELSKEAKEKAVQQVMRYEETNRINFGKGSKEFHDAFVNKFCELGLKVSNVYFDFACTDSPAQFEVKETAIFFEKNLSAFDYQSYIALKGIVHSVGHRFFEEEAPEREVYRLEYDDFAWYGDRKECMNFIVHYSSKPELQLKYKFPLLMESELTYEEGLILEREMESVRKEVRKRLSDRLNSVILKLQQELSLMVEDRKKAQQEMADSRNSSQPVLTYYEEKLEKDETYCFTESGVWLPGSELPDDDAFDSTQYA